MNFTVEGADVTMPGEGSPLVKLAHKSLNALPDGKLWTVERLASAINRSRLRTKDIVAHGDFKNYRARSGARYLYGSRRTIQLWQKTQAKPASAKS